MNPVDGRQQKIVFGRDHDSEYASKLKAAKAQSDSGNQYMWGQQAGQDNLMQGLEAEGFGMISEDSRDPKYGNVNRMTRELIDGNQAAGFADSAGNQVLSREQDLTGFISPDGNQTFSSTIAPQVQPGQELAELGMDDAAQRVNGLANGKQWGTHNNRQNTWRA